MQRHLEEPGANEDTLEQEPHSPEEASDSDSGGSDGEDEHYETVSTSAWQQGPLYRRK